MTADTTPTVSTTAAPSRVSVEEALAFAERLYQISEPHWTRSERRIVALAAEVRRLRAAQEQQP